MTWRLPEQDPCTEPCCTTGPVKPASEAGTGSPTSRGIRPDEGRRAWCDCGPLTVCLVCAPGTTWRVPTEDPYTPEWAEDLAPVEPPESGHEKARPLKREPGGVSHQHTAFGFTEFGQRRQPSPSIIRRIFNATRMNT